MRLPGTICLAVSCVLMASPAHADDRQAWGTVTTQVALGGAWRVHNEVVARTGAARGFYEVEENLMVGVKASKQVTLWVGYTFNPALSHGHLNVTEHRIRQQINADRLAQLGPVRLSGRVRLEERWRDGIAGTAWRLRPQIKASLPIHGKTTLAISHESFIDLNTTSFQRVGGTERMRNAIALSTPLASTITAEVGYLEQHGFVRSGPDSNDHILTVGLSASF